MDNVRFGEFVWPENPEIITLSTRTDPIYEIDPNGQAQFKAMSEISRFIEVRGVFRGPKAYHALMKLRALLDRREPREFQYSSIGVWHMYLTKLEAEEEDREGLVAYHAAFRGVDAAGCVPPLPDEPGAGVR